MAGAALKLAGAATASPFGKFHPYEGTYDSTVALWDGGYQPGPVPPQGATVPNLLRDRMVALTGLAPAACDFTVLNQTGAFLGTERTAKGGIHAASTQAGGQTGNAAFSLELSSAFNQWLLARTDATEDFAVLFTAYLVKTRSEALPNSAIQAISWFARGAQATSNYFYHTQGGRPAPDGTVPPALIAGQPFLAADMPGLLAVASQGWTGTKAGAAEIDACFLNAGCRGPWGGANLNKAPSYILYRAQLDLVDLSDIAGADRAAKASAMLSAVNAVQVREFADGGRFAGDQYTPAATLKP